MEPSEEVDISSIDKDEYKNLPRSSVQLAIRRFELDDGWIDRLFFFLVEEGDVCFASRICP
jgi:hypothetical protein